MIVATWECNGVDSLLCILLLTAPLLICQLPYTESNSQLVVTSVGLDGQQGVYLLLAWWLPLVAWSTVCTGSQILVSAGTCFSPCRLLRLSLPSLTPSPAHFYSKLQEDAHPSRSVALHCPERIPNGTMSCQPLQISASIL